MEAGKKPLIYILTLAVFSIGFLGAHYTFIGDAMITGSFTDASEANANPSTDAYKPHIEEVYWKFGNKTVKGRMTYQNFSEGTHNVTAVLVKSNGKNETYEAQIDIK
jgi:uncharacterized membrane protein